MREDVVTPTTARRLAAEGLGWEPQLGDWCTVMGAEHVSETRVGLWLGGVQSSATGLLGLADAAGRWPATQGAQRDCLWLPPAGKLKPGSSPRAESSSSRRGTSGTQRVSASICWKSGEPSSVPPLPTTTGAVPPWSAATSCPWTALRR